MFLLNVLATGTAGYRTTGSTLGRAGKDVASFAAKQCGICSCTRVTDILGVQRVRMITPRSFAKKLFLFGHALHSSILSAWRGGPSVLFRYHHGRGGPSLRPLRGREPRTYTLFFFKSLEA
jgi:hypothetical protein